MLIHNLAARSPQSVLADLCVERGITVRQLVVRTREATGCDQSTIYRVLDGSTRDPHISVLAAICRGLDVRPQEVFERTGLWTRQSESANAAEFRRAWTAVACLPDSERVRITQVVRALVDAAHAHQSTVVRGPSSGPSRQPVPD